MGAPVKNQTVLHSILGSFDNFLKGVFHYPKDGGGKERGKLFSLYFLEGRQRNRAPQVLTYRTVMSLFMMKM
jgi:hypothetical protein